MTINKESISLLCEAIKNNDLDAYRKFYYEFYRSINHFLFRYVSDKDAAFDLTQDTFVKFWNNRDRLDANNDPRAYLFKIARNLAINYLEKEKKRAPGHDPENYSDSDVVEGYENKFLMNDFSKALNLLPLRCREIFMLSRYENMKYAEIAELLNLSVQTVKNQMNKALKILREELKNYSNCS